MAYVSPWFLILHIATDYLIHPYGGSHNPAEGTSLVIHPSRTDIERLLFRFVQVQGHWGYIEHRGGLIYYPENPKSGDFVYLRKTRKDGSLLTIDQTNNMIVHKNGLEVCGVDDFGIPGVPPLLGMGAVGFYRPGTWAGKGLEKWRIVSEITFKDLKVFPNPNPSGNWTIVHAVINPSSGQTKEFSYSIGRTKSTSNNVVFKWEITTEFARSMFESSVFTQFLTKTGKQTWEGETTRTKKVTVLAGQSVVTWQWVYELEQWGDKYIYKSDILQETDSPDQKPKLSITN